MRFLFSLIMCSLLCASGAFAQQQRPDSDLTDYAKMLEAYRLGDQLQIKLLEHQLIEQARAAEAKEKADIAAVNKWWCGKACEPKVTQHQKP